MTPYELDDMQTIVFLTMTIDQWESQPQDPLVINELVKLGYVQRKRDAEGVKYRRKSQKEIIEFFITK